MGLFSSSKKIVVGTSVVRAIKDEVLPDAIKSGVTKAIFGNEDVPDTVVEALIGSVGVRAERMYEYGRTKYTHGLPSGEFHSAVDGQAEVTALLSSLEGTPVSLLYCHYRPRNLMHIGWIKLLADHGYDPLTNQLAGLSASLGKTVYLEDMMVVVPAATLSDYQAGALELWGTSASAGYTPLRQAQQYTGGLRMHTPVVADAVATEPYVRVEYIWEILPAGGIGLDTYHPPTVGRGTLQISVSDYDTKADYFHAKYMVGTTVKYVMYQGGLGTYPTLDAIFNRPPATNGTFFPFAYFRYNHTSEISDKTTDAYKTSKKLVKYLGMDYDQVATAIDESPNIADVMQAMMILAVPANTSNPLEQRYLFSFFDNMFYSDANQFSSPEWSGVVAAQLGTADITKTSLIIQDKRFKMALSNSGIYKKLVPAHIGAVGTHASSVEEVMVEEMYSTGWMNDNAPAVRMIPVKVHVYKRQISHSLCEEIRVVNLRVLYHVYGEYTVTADEFDDTLLIPIDHSITQDYPIAERETLYSRAMHYVFNSVQTITVEWYQTGLFAALVTIVAVFITVWSFGSASGPMAGLMSALATGSTVVITAAVMALLEQLLIGLVISYAFKLFTKAVGGDVAILLAVVALVYGGYTSYQAGSVANAPWAKELLQISSGLTKAVSANVQDMMKDLLAEYQSFNIFKDEQTKQLEEANKLLSHDNWLNPFVIFGESPNDFYNRTVHSGNIGTVGISAISSYVDIALKLPELNQTIEQFT